ncbi:uncharacterized protein LOC127505693 isoform X26 [Ctenopharyngodon idella]|uniref:uncharacterized protein LOC127505693 isoform X21 n=1 Tax=Ctenopharyngodon idella TaxID=7959 RepID=UPI00222F7138|nr:uncharacterized protein LOC127505693 isoform X21 [Ctenopharyngodon idella]XP_051737377.1 uncharacterized protein LOC127505693 isoform X22 [Ctenopharyngodon idella]XP_051737379.1 uncharacterized protein LOC127505693 isoform X23 [Ctenopharyngodon idella]XP_051737380.1 uncharacterized protein LOC127505693 isoform X24 [Ctenopharyngodon idella]XP_051737381.1 uncharacterized protein LOC127505693 isoform X25 [Ctenopharyngodon idella]XP_051737382.1 uncharacterized protein LOC127505693 isoform X26 [
MTKHDFTLFLFFSAVASATFSDEQEFCESESCNERDFDKSHFYSNVKYCGEIPLTLSHKLIDALPLDEVEGHFIRTEKGCVFSESQPTPLKEPLTLAAVSQRHHQYPAPSSCDLVHHHQSRQSSEYPIQMPGSTLRQCPHCRIKMNCRHRSCVKCGKLLDFKYKQSVRLAKFRDQAHQWAKTTVKSRNQSKVFDNLAIMMEKLKVLGYVPLLLLGKCSKAHRWTAEVQCPFEFPPEGHKVMEKMLILFEHILQGFGPEKEQEVTEGNEAERQDLKETVEDEEDITLENNVEVERLEDEEQIEEQQIESGEEEPERPVEEQSFKSPEKEQEDTEGDRTESQDINEAAEDEENILSENNVDLRMKERLEDEEQIEEQQTESGGEEPERPVNEEGEMKVTKKTKQAKEMKKQAEKQKISALKMDEMDERKEIEGVVLKPDCKSAVNMAAKRKRQKNTDTECPFHASLDVFPVEFVSKTHLRKGRKEVLVHWLPCPSWKTWPPTFVCLFLSHCYSGQIKGLELIQATTGQRLKVTLTSLSQRLHLIYLTVF